MIFTTVPVAILVKATLLKFLCSRPGGALERDLDGGVANHHRCPQTPLVKSKKFPLLRNFAFLLCTVSLKQGVKFFAKPRKILETSKFSPFPVEISK